MSFQSKQMVARAIIRHILTVSMLALKKGAYYVVTES